MLFCPTCSTANRFGSRYCNECGRRLDVELRLPGWLSLTEEAGVSPERPAAPGRRAVKLPSWLGVEDPSPPAPAIPAD